MKKILLVVVLFFGVLSACTSQESTTYYLIRHAEKNRTDKTNRNPDLNKKGVERAKKWASYFKNIKIDADSEDAILPKINYDVRSIPAYIWVDGDGNMVYEYRGTTTIQNFMILGENALMNGGKIKL
jgi:thioredoxin-related protein